MWKIENIIELKNIDKGFSGVQVLHSINFTLKKGEVKGLVGMNGAGKSTLMKIIQGIYIPDGGSIRILGENIPYNAPMKERTKNVGMIYQDFSLVPEMTVTENIFLNEEVVKNSLIDEKTSLEKVKELFERYGFDIDPNAKVSNLNSSDMQTVEICKQLIRNKEILLMDEPTAGLEADQAQKLYEIIGKLKKEGISIIFITHHLKEIIENCDSVDVLSDGKITMSEKIDNITIDDIIAGMLGNKDNKVNKQRTVVQVNKDEPILELRNVTTSIFKKPISFKLYKGEVLGLAGLKGSGRTELMHVLYGLDPILSGEVILNGKKIQANHPSAVVEEGMFLIPENRQVNGVVLEHTLYQNMTLPWLEIITNKNLFVNDSKGLKMVSEKIEQLQVKCNSSKDIIENLSGGNQQKVVIAKALGIMPKILLMDDPTFGVDVYAKEQIMDIVDRFKQEGGSVIMISSELDEIIDNCNRILILRRREIVGEFDNYTYDSINQEKLTVAIQ